MSEVQTNAVQVQVPAGFIAILESFHFRKFKDTEELRAKQLPAAASADHPITVTKVVEEGITKFQRTPEQHTLLIPTPEYFGAVSTPENKEALVVLQSAITSLVKAAARKLVDAGVTPTEANCSWGTVCKEEYKRLTEEGSSGPAISKEVLKAFCDKFTAWATAMGRNAAGTQAIVKMITARFNEVSVLPFLPVLKDKIEPVIQSFFLEGLDENEQNVFGEVLLYIEDRITKALEPKEAIDPDSMFD